MGIESFQVRLRGSGAYSEIAEWLSRELGAFRIPSPEAKPNIREYFAISDGRHFLEVDLESEGPRKILVACRFALCHPATVDRAFIALVADLAGGLSLSVEIIEDVPDELPDKFLPEELGDTFSGVVQRSISEKRLSWIACFGDETAALSCEEADRRFMAPRMT